MLRGTVNETATIKALHNWEIMVKVHGIDVLHIIVYIRLACSPEEIALLNVQVLEHFGYKEHLLISVEIRTSMKLCSPNKLQKSVFLKA